MPTEQMKKEFGRMNAGYTSANPQKKQNKTSNGSLWLDGYLHLYNLPFPILQAEKRKLMNNGYTSKRIRIGYNKK